jgi:HEAT repeat protein
MIVVAVSIVALSAIAWLLLLSHEEKESVYEGKPLRVWLKGFDASQGSADYAAAQEAVRQMGTNVLPNLIAYLLRKDPPFYPQWIHLKDKLHLLQGEVDYAVFWHRRAAHACGALGEAGEAAFPAMIEAINDPGAAFDVGNALSRMMPSSVPVLTNILAMGNATARARAADNLVTAYSHPEVEAPARVGLLAALHDPDPGVRMAAASAFQFWNTRLEIVVPGLLAMLNDPYPNVRATAATSLGNFGAAARMAVPQLMRLLQDTNGYASGTVADRAAQMLSKIDPEGAARASAE